MPRNRKHKKQQNENGGMPATVSQQLRGSFISEVTAVSHAVPVAEAEIQYDPHNRNRNSFRSASAKMTQMSGPSGTSSKASRKMDTKQFTELIKEGYSTGLARALVENVDTFDFRFWLVDNSGSMLIGDGHRYVPSGKGDGSLKAVPSTRWAEITETVRYHAHLAALLDSPTIFQLLNDPNLRTIPQRFSVCERGEAYAASEVVEALSIMRRVSPSGVTPLTQHIWDIQQNISAMANDLRKKGKKVALILATDGLPTDEQGCGGQEITNAFVRALRSLEGLPIWIVIRLCTDEDDVTEFYNSLDDELELSLEVIDDYKGEAQEVYAQNKWICYGVPLHRCRELGYHNRLFDMIDERPFTLEEVRSFCCLLFGIEEDELPDPMVNFDAFLKEVDIRLQTEQLQYNPIKKKMTPWILTKELKKAYSDKACVIS
mmetsp:Transcript_22412/g.36653  ORF Transcript_22412/g.36653 Transcript_22412/m.36653 type:complete len:431 (-) Transcript_22412:193-1485(-)|eukprot:scaffold3437_cov145-Skeletonema_menzelii.AAC.13